MIEDVRHCESVVSWRLSTFGLGSWLQESNSFGTFSVARTRLGSLPVSRKTVAARESLFSVALDLSTSILRPLAVRSAIASLPLIRM